MGCYGIGVGRLLACLAEARHDAYGPIWPISVAPWQVHIVALDIAKEGVAEAADMLYADLTAAGLETILDDREESSGVKFADADLLGVPLRLTVSPRNMKNGVVEWRIRGTEQREMVPLDAEAHARAPVQRAKSWVEASLQELRDSADRVRAPAQ